MQVTHQPHDPGPAPWLALLHELEPLAPLSADRRADVLIIGGGFAGLAAARRLHQLDPGLQIVLLEARAIGEGSAGRNSGFMVDLPHHLASDDYAGDADKDRELIRMNRRAIDFITEAAAEFEMPAETIRRLGKVNGAATASGDRHNRDYAEHLSRLGEACEHLDQRQMREYTGSNYYLSGLHTPGTALLQPAMYVRRLAEALHTQGVALHERTPVQSLQRSGSHWQAHTPGGRVDAERVVLCVNGHVESFGHYQKRLMHIYLFASMSAVLDQATVAQLGQPNWGITPSHPIGSSVRRFDGAGGTRLLIRNGIYWSPARHADTAKVQRKQRQHEAGLKARFPALYPLPIEYRWGGLLCLSLNAAPAFGELDAGLYSACCQNGLGTTNGTLAGMTIAERLLAAPGEDTPLSDWLAAQGEPSRLPPEPFLGIGARVRLAMGEWRAGAEL